LACPYKTKEEEEEEEQEEQEQQQPQRQQEEVRLSHRVVPAPGGNHKPEKRPDHHPIRIPQPHQPLQPQTKPMMIMPTPIMPMPTPAYSVRRRILDDTYTTALDSVEGTRRLLRAMMTNDTAAAQQYIRLTQHAVNQSDPAYCGITTAVIVLNTFGCDTIFRWKGGWRYWHENVLLQHCPCLLATPVEPGHDHDHDPDHNLHLSQQIQSTGITMDEFHRIMTCQNVTSVMKRPHDNNDDNDDPSTAATSSGSSITNIDTGADSDDDGRHQRRHDLDDFRRDVMAVCCCSTSSSDDSDEGHHNHNAVLVVNFARSLLGQTGDGHFSPLGAYDRVTDSVLVIDVARFKYPYYWATLSQLYQAMIPSDLVTGLSRGWFRLSVHEKKDRFRTPNEERRPIHAAPLVEHDPHPCPVQPIKVTYCQNNNNNNNHNHHNKQQRHSNTVRPKR
jgi:glutathione gamma-glutamylcysteinyltransferase